MNDSPAYGYYLGKRDLFGRRELSRLIAPRSVAVVGASATPGSFGLRTLENIIHAGYSGKVFPINPKRDQIMDLPCYSSVEELPEIPDCVIIAVPRDNVEDVVERCAALGVGGAIVNSSGFAEVGIPERIAAQRRLATIAHESGMRVLGPNCVGIANLTHRVGLTFMPKFYEMPMTSGPIGMISQSGALGYTVMQALERGIGFSHYLSPGNSCDVDICDFINYLVEDEATRVIGCMFEGVRDGDRLIEAAKRALAADKPLVIYKTGDSEISRRTALSHTGTLVGAKAAYDAAFKQTGAIVVNDWEDLLETAGFFSKAGHPSTQGIGVMASSGGAAVIAADKAEELGVDLPPPASETVEKLNGYIPEFGSVANPADMTAETLKSLDIYGDCIRAFHDDPSYSAVVVPMMSAHKPATVERARYLCELSGDFSKPMCLVWINEWHQGPGSEVYDACPSIAMFRSMKRCIKTLKLWLDHYARRDQLLRPRSPRVSSAQAADEARAILAQSGASAALSEGQSKRLLASYGIPVTQEVLVNSVDEAVEAASRIGYPVVLKADSAEILHKTEAGVVRLNLRDADSVRTAYAEIMSTAESLANRPRLNGILVQKMIESGAELLIGAGKDPQFGPMITCGFGGIAVEITADVSTALAPVDQTQAQVMIGSLKGCRLLTGYRNMPALDVDALADMVCRVSELIADLRDDVHEIDVNPVILGTAGGIAVDALVVRKNEKEVTV